MSNRFHLLSLAVGVALGLSAGSGAAAAANVAKPSCSLRSVRQVDTIDRVVTILEVSGVLKSPEGEKTEQSKMSVAATMAYDERTLELSQRSSGRLRSVRHYDRAEAKIDVAEGKLSPTLRGDRRLMAVEIDDGKVTLFSPQGRLTRDELDLVDLPANSLLVDRFLPSGPVAQGDTWKHPDDLVLATFGLDRLAKQTLASTVTKIDPDAALVELSGRVEGAVDGVTTQIEVKGKYRFDRRARRIDWFGLLAHEIRGVGHVGPGIEVVARLRMQIAPRDGSKELSERALEGLPLEPTPQLTQLVYGPERGGWRFEHDRRWFSTGSDEQLAFLRLIERGDFIAQCNVAVLDRVEPGNQATLEQFQADIQKALGDRFGEFVEAGQKANDQNYRVLRVVARGMVSELPIEWHYYLVADEHGRQITFTFTVEGPLAKRLGQMDRQMVASLRFDPPSVAAAEKTTR